MSDIGIDDYELKEWITQFGSMPVRRLLHGDYSRSYEMEVSHVFQLENGKFAYVNESGCSCYSPDKASIDVLPTFELAEKKFREWETEQKRYSE